MENNITLTQLTAEDYALFFQKGISYEKYVENMVYETENNIEGQYAKYLPLNLQRTKRIGKTMKLHTDSLSVLGSLTHKVNWLVITEAWCGDSSQIMPIIDAFAEASAGMIDLRIVYRDENFDLIDAHLTNGGRAIPKLIQLDSDFKVTGIWGPRPAEAQALVVKLKSDPETAPHYADLLHKWYGDDKTFATQNELLDLLKTD